MKQPPGKEAVLRGAVFLTEWGWCGLAWRGKDVLRAALCFPDEEAAQRALGPVGGTARGRPPYDLVRRLRRYFQGRAVDFEDVPLAAGTPFQRLVWAAARRIPRGTTRTYQALARNLGRPGAARAVGAALGRNPLPVIVPCHRVVAADGRLGGFSAPGGVALKARLLRLEEPGATPAPPWCNFRQTHR